MLITLVNDTARRSKNPGCQLTSRTFQDLLGGAGTALRPLEWGFGRRLQSRDRNLWQALGTGRWLEQPVLRALAETEYGPGAVQSCIRTDCVVFQPEGTVSDDADPLRILRFLSLPLWCALHGRVPLVVANGTFPLFDGARAELVRLLLDHADRAVMRDRISARHWGVACAPDSAVLWRGLPQTADASWLLITTAAESPPETDLAIGRAGLDSARRLGLRPLILGKGWERMAPLRPEIDAMGGRILESTLLDEVDRHVAACRLHLGGRYHMALLCATKGIPSALIRTNTHKNLWLAEECPGIRMAADPAALTATAQALLACPEDAILADIVRLSDETRSRLSDLPLLRRREPVPPPGLSRDLSRRLARPLRRDLWRHRLRTLRP
ncbi:Polysaccharide pyruvyl transferase [Paracoccus sediminis]|nr:Polysaccharide pyruvyl transferase [Paracoccus sediminis]